MNKDVKRNDDRRKDKHLGETETVKEKFALYEIWRRAINVRSQTVEVFCDKFDFVLYNDTRGNVF